MFIILKIHSFIYYNIINKDITKKNVFILYEYLIKSAYFYFKSIFCTNKTY